MNWATRPRCAHPAQGRRGRVGDQGRSVDTKAGWALRYLRALLLSSMALALAIVAHLSAGGLLPELWTFGAMLALSVLLSGRWFGREASTFEIVSLLAAGQTLMHGAMTALAGHVGDTAPPPSSPGHALVHAAEHLIEDMTPEHAPMALAHLVAAVLTGLWLARGERALWNLLRLLASTTRETLHLVLRPAATPPQASRLLLPAPPFLLERSTRALFLATTHVRRGPPVGAGAH